MFTNQYIIVDDFYGNPDMINQIAKNMKTEEISSGNYAGIMTTDDLFTDDIRYIFSQMSGVELVGGTELNGRFRFSTVNDTAKQQIHFDPGLNQVWSAVVYLEKEPPDSTEEDLRNYGTHFWTHNRTGLSSIPMTQEGIEQHGWKGVSDLKEFLETEGNDESLWTRTFTVPYRYNRLVMFRPWLFHSPGQHFGLDKSACRLIQTFFLGVKQQD
jgi:hypothetical protein